MLLDPFAMCLALVPRSCTFPLYVRTTNVFFQVTKNGILGPVPMRVNRKPHGSCSNDLGWLPSRTDFRECFMRHGGSYLVLSLFSAGMDPFSFTPVINGRVIPSSQVVYSATLCKSSCLFPVGPGTPPPRTFPCGHNSAEYS